MKLNYRLSLLKFSPMWGSIGCDDKIINAVMIPKNLLI